jgi:hypothetical protein
MADTGKTEINVIVFPPMGAGTTPNGMIIPTLTYPKVTDLEKIDVGSHMVLMFRTRTGDRITTSLPYIIQEVVPAPGIHEA